MDAVYMLPTCFGIKVDGCTFSSYRGFATCWDAFKINNIAQRQQIFSLLNFNIIFKI
jgi:hypothetical protein